ncbi:RDD family protein [Rathayibacter rathayi]|uniref:RDD family protein n=1 Tax=Rathayibacter rathayi TaxID=33887 RepID=A0ABD6WAX5_RATRA|nr:RDD family protein [Rathayibacter rathayi]AZZ48825.1 RDD family protein [Rathayibacter rathayi]MWV73917.1 RDD family protein [Rathayibacter rathayi NCPPB 2980 = VKM Ac-1601]PPF15392.1 RDD family protein [Rathayibacter rathayi]PPF24806.1 RDD family protein [Rathayibacter rathayi]PPF48825.1 RDD family protein [Rathayibacter rathayi]
MPTADRRTFADAAPSEYPGERLGLPREGRLSIARPGRRIAALAADFAVAALLSLAFFDYDRWASLLLFILLQVVFIPTIGGSVGHRLLGMRVVRLGGGWVGVWRPLVRSVLLAVLVPALVWDSDQRGFHDKVAATVLVRS